ncbi:phosphotransferase family protein [Brevibacterium oceani]|uniref:phosphotransferase family protein n=1 Tax=Brevibacterium oceani TaxID=358099 RepID=UPI001FE64FFA|nr:aminoglycoside phosphotransferase family protein [Brevibacterium oceani]
MSTAQQHALRSASALLGRELRLVEIFTAGQHATTLLASDGEDEFVVRSFPAGDATAAKEPEVLLRLSTLGEQVPRLIEHRADLDDPFIITTRVPGSTPDPALPASTIAREMARALVRIHALDGTGLPQTPTVPPIGDSPIAHRVRAGFAELLQGERVLSHGDFWCGNALWSGERLTGVVDWTGASHAPRGRDLSWCRQDLVLLGSPDAAAEFLDEYESLLGRRITDIHAWDLHAAASAIDRVETWLPNYHGIGRTEITAELLRRRLDEWNSRL